MRWPLMFGLQPSTLNLLNRADYVYDLEREFDVPGDVVFNTFFDNGLSKHVFGLCGFIWQTPPNTFDAAVVDESFVYMSVRMRTTAYEPGSRLVMSIDRCSLPLGRQMLQVMEAAPRAGGGCRFRWRIAVRYLPGMSPLAPSVTPLFRRMFEQTLEAVERHCASETRQVRSRSQDARANTGSGTGRSDPPAAAPRSIAATPDNDR